MTMRKCWQCDEYGEKAYCSLDCALKRIDELEEKVENLGGSL